MATNKRSRKSRVESDVPVTLTKSGKPNAKRKALRNKQREKVKPKSDDDNKLKKEAGGGGSTDMHVVVDQCENPMPLGDVIESEDGTRKCYSAFEFDGKRYQLEDSVLIAPEEEYTRPGVGIIKGISESLNGSMYVTVQWFYRPEQLETADFESWVSIDNRELLISNHQDEVPAESIMHPCIVHFLPGGEKLPDRKKHPGHIVLYFYDCLKQKVYKITDGEYMDSLHQDIRNRIKKTQLRISFEHTSTNKGEANEN